MIPLIVDPKQVALGLVGRERACERRLEQLLQSGAGQVAVFSNAPSAGLAACAGARLRRRLPAPDDLARLAVVWIVDLPLAEARPLARAARAAGCLVNVEDVIELCDFHNPAQVRRGDLLLTVSTGGRSPGLAARIRRELAGAFGPEWADRLKWIAAKRRAWRQSGRSLDDLARLTNASIDAEGWLRKDRHLNVLEHLDDLRRAYEGLEGLALLRALLKEGPLAGRTALVSSFGAESAVLLDMVATVDPATPVIFLDTGKLFAETQAYREEMVGLLRLRDVRVVKPRAHALKRYDAGGDLWRREPDLCCHIRKTEPLQEALEGFAGWITGRKRFQAGLRSHLPTIEAEWSSGRIKVNPLALWSAEDVERYRRLRNLPRHPLVDRGYCSIGCTTCTRPVASGEAARAGRWWGLDKTECGIHLPAKDAA